MLKTSQERLQMFKKANKVYRAKMAAKAGFVTVEQYLQHLQGLPLPTATSITINVGKVKKDKKKAKVEGFVPTIHNVHILDASGSMQGGKFNNSLAGINSEIEVLKNDTTVNYTQTTVIFTSNNANIHWTKNFLASLKDVGSISGHAMGGTPLYQAVGETLRRLMSTVSPTDKVLVKIFTDGEENSSYGEFAPINNGVSRLASLIKEVESRGFTVTFVGTDYDVARIIQNLSIHESNTLVHDNTARGMEMSFMASTASTMSYASKIKAGKNVTRGFYKKIKN